jgi:hypothetical protein
MEYNTERNKLVMREYGRHIQRMIEQTLEQQNNEERQRNAQAVIDLMGILNPQLKNVEDYRHKLWDHLFFISDFKLDVESPYPIPQKETYKAKPEPLKYPKRYPKYSHLGKNLETIINKAMAETDEEKRVGFANAIAYYMKLSYGNWHKENVHDETIRAELDAITQGQLNFSNMGYVKAYRQGDENQYGGAKQHRPGGKMQFRKNGVGNNNGRNNNNRNNNNRNGNNKMGPNKGGGFKKRY